MNRWVCSSWGVRLYANSVAALGSRCEERYDVAADLWLEGWDKLSMPPGRHGHVVESLTRKLPADKENTIEGDADGTVVNNIVRR